MNLLDRYGADTEFAIIKGLIEEPSFMRDIYPILDQNMFLGQEKANMAIVVIIKDYFKENGQAPTWNTLELLVKNKYSGNDTQLQKLLPAVMIVKNTKLLDFTDISQVAIEFFQEKSCIKIMNEINESVKSKDKPMAIVKKIEKATKEIKEIGISNNFLFPMTDENIGRIFEDTKSSVIPTGIKELDELIGGGMRKKEAGLFIAPTGYGKTTLSTIFAQGAYRNDFNVLQIFFEDTPNDMMRKHCSAISRIDQYRLMECDDAKKRDFLNRLNKTTDYPKLKKHLKLLKMKNGDTTIEDLIAEINKLKDGGFVPDVIIIDYFDCLKHSADKTKDIWQAQARCMRKIVDQIAFDFDCAVWVFQQTNRGGASADSNTKSPYDKIQGSYQIVQPCTVFLELRKSEEQFKTNRADIIIGKSRHAKRKGNLMDIVFDNGCCYIDASDALINEKDLEFYE